LAPVAFNASFMSLSSISMFVRTLCTSQLVGTHGSAGLAHHSRVQSASGAWSSAPKPSFASGGGMTTYDLVC
jgi:hypothetical protein